MATMNSQLLRKSWGGTGPGASNPSKERDRRCPDGSWRCEGGLGVSGKGERRILGVRGSLEGRVLPRLNVPPTSSSQMASGSTHRPLAGSLLPGSVLARVAGSCGVSASCGNSCVLPLGRVTLWHISHPHLVEHV